MSEAASPMTTAWMAQATEGCQDCLEACTCWHQEVTRFVGQRIAENGGTWRALLATRDPVGFVKLQQQWANKAAADYTAEFMRLAQLITAVSLTGKTPDVLESTTLVE